MIRIVLLTVLFSILACARKDDSGPPELPPTPMLSSESFWAMVNRSYAPILADPVPQADVVFLLRRGDIVEIELRKTQPESGRYWLRIRKDDSESRGWIRESDLDIYESEMLARVAYNTMFED